MRPSPSPHALGTRSLALDRAVMVLDDQLVPLPRPHEPVRHPYGPVVGIRCTPRTAAVAYPVAARLVRSDATRRKLAVVVPRDGTAHIVDPCRDAPLPVSVDFGPVVDVGRRALGLATPAERSPPVVLLDAIWVERVLVATLDADIGHRPTWATISALHPLAGAALTPSMLRDRRLSLGVEWSPFRRRATGFDTAWPDLSPSLAEWLDDGSFARWVLGELPPTTPLLGDLAELLDEAVVADIDEALSGAPRW